MNLAQVLPICPALEVNVLKIELMGIVEQSKARLWDTKEQAEVLQMFRCDRRPQFLPFRLYQVPTMQQESCEERGQSQGWKD